MIAERRRGAILVGMSDALAREVYDACHLSGEFLLRSGQVSTEYFDKYLFETRPALLHEVARGMVELLPDCDVLAGMEMGGIPIATVMSQLTGLPIVFVRKQAKSYGTCKAVEGASVRGLRVVAVEDVITTAGALVKGCSELRSAGAIVETAVCAIDRDQGGRSALASEEVDLRSLMDRATLERAAGANHS